MIFVAKFCTPTVEKAECSSLVWPMKEKFELIFATRVFSRTRSA